MYFDGSVMKTGVGAGLLFISPLGVHMCYMICLHFPASNNMAEYEALLGASASPSNLASSASMYAEILNLLSTK